jgi:hypothetical protein
MSSGKYQVKFTTHDSSQNNTFKGEYAAQRGLITLFFAFDLQPYHTLCTIVDKVWEHYF